jgi:glyoxylase-like metal-dependent hydrolase (beta-lactamase superfamily II)
VVDIKLVAYAAVKEHFSCYLFFLNADGGCMFQIRQVVVGVALFCTVLTPIFAEDMDEVVIKSQKVADGIYMLQGQGGNIAALGGEQGVVLIDDQFAPLTEKIRAAVKKFSNAPVRFVINTHWHYDHVGGNENFAKIGSVVVAHKNVRQRMGVEQFLKAFNKKVPASPLAALPVVTFENAIELHLNGQTIKVEHVEHAHTDGDSFVYFKEANVLHMGDVFFNRSYPFIDSSSGGSVKGVLAGVEKALAMVDGKTKIIPGHGPLASKKDLKAYHKLLRRLQKKIGGMKEKGMSLEEVLKQQPTKKWDEVWGKGFLKPQQFVTIFYGAL